VYIGFWWGNLSERDHFEDLYLDGWIILKWVLKKWFVDAWTRLMWLGALVNAIMNLRVP